MNYMETFYHGSCRLFNSFSLSHLGEGEGKSKFGHGIYVTSSYDTAVLYAAKAGKANGVSTFYVYTVEVPDLDVDNHIFSCRPVPAEVAQRIGGLLNAQIPPEASASGKFFRKYVGNLITHQLGSVRQMTGKADAVAESAASKFFGENGIVCLAWPQAQTNPDGITNRAILREDCIRIVRIEQVEADDRNRFVEGSQREISL